MRNSGGMGLLLFVLAYWVSSYIALGILVVILASRLPLDGNAKPQRFITDKLLFLVLLTYALLGVFVGGVAGEPVIAAKIYLIPFIAFSVFQGLEYDRRLFEVVVGGVAIVCTFLSSYMYFQVQPGVFDFSLEFFFGRPRYNGFYFRGDEIVGPTVIAAVIATAFVSSLYFVTSGPILVRGIALVLNIYLVFLQVLSGSRTAIVGSLLAAVVFLHVAYRQRSGAAPKVLGWGGGQRIVLFAFLALIGGLSINYALEYSPGALYRFGALFGGEIDSSLLTRFLLWRQALDFADENLLGSGPSYFLEKTGLTTHNEFLGILVATGIMGLVLYLLFFAILFVGLIRGGCSVKPAIRAYFLSFLVVVLMVSMTENYSRSSVVIFNPLVWCVIGMMASVYGRSRIRV